MSNLTKTQTRSLKVVPAAVTRVRAIETRLADLTARVCPAPVVQIIAIEAAPAPVAEVAPIVEATPAPVVEVAAPVEVHLFPSYLGRFSAVVDVAGSESRERANSSAELANQIGALVRAANGGAAPASLLFVLHPYPSRLEEDKLRADLDEMHAVAALIAFDLGLCAGEVEAQKVGDWETGCFVSRALPFADARFELSAPPVVEENPSCGVPASLETALRVAAEYESAVSLEVQAAEWLRVERARASFLRSLELVAKARCEMNEWAAKIDATPAGTERARVLWHYHDVVEARFNALHVACPELSRVTGGPRDRFTAQLLGACHA